MASSPILHRGSYDHYKTRTKVFINWLTEAARKCCKLEDVVAALKDRAGKRAKKMLLGHSTAAMGLKRQQR